MILFAPNVFVAQYLKETGQTKPDLQTKAENLMLTGYQRQLTYRRNDGSFSAFGNNDQQGSLWLSAFVLRTFNQAKGLIYIDETVLTTTRAWLGRQQKSDGSYTPVGFVHSPSLLGGLQGNLALTAFLAVTLLESGDNAGVALTVGYLEKNLASIQDAYGLALTTYALELAKSPQVGEAYNRLIGAARQSQDGLYWGDREFAPTGQTDRSAIIETTGYALLALLAHNDRTTAAQVARWLVARRNAFGGWESTQDTVVGLQSLAKFVAFNKSQVDATLSVRGLDWQKEIRIGPDNADVMQIMAAPPAGQVTLELRGQGQAVLQSVRRFNLPDPVGQNVSAFRLNVDYGATELALNNELTIKVAAHYTPPEPTLAGMVVLEVALPTGFAALDDSLIALVTRWPKLKRYDTNGRKVQLYIEDMAPDEKLALEFKAAALYPIKAQAVTSQVYAYYRPEWRGESLGGAITVRS